MTGIPFFLFLSQTIWTTLPETLKPWRDGNSSFRLLKKQILLAEVMSFSRTLASHHVITPWHDYEGSIDELEITRAPCTPPPPLCMYIFLFLSFLLLISWLHRGNMPACTQFLLSPCHKTGTFFLHSSKIHIQLSAFQKLVATVLQAFQHHHHLLCSHLPQITGGQCRTQRERREKCGERMLLPWAASQEHSRNADAVRDRLTAARKGVGSAFPNFLLRAIAIQRFSCLFLLSSI